MSTKKQIIIWSLLLVGAMLLTFKVKPQSANIGAGGIVPDEQISTNWANQTQMSTCYSYINAVSNYFRTNVFITTLVYSNFLVEGGRWTNTFGRIVDIVQPINMTPASVAGQSKYSLILVGVTTNSQTFPSLLGVLLSTAPGQITLQVPINGVVIATNLSTGLGVSAALANGASYELRP